MKKGNQPLNKSLLKIEVEPITAQDSVELEEYEFTPIEDSENSKLLQEKKSGFFYPDRPEDSGTTKWAKILTSYLALLFSIIGLLTSILVWFLPFAIQNNLTFVIIILFVLLASVIAATTSVVGFVLGALRFRHWIGISAMIVALAGLISNLFAFRVFWQILESISA